MGRSLLLTAPRQVEWVTEALPPVGPHDVLVETAGGAISHGTELPLYRGSSRASGPAHYPRMTGYESLGIVRAHGAAGRGVRVGDRVVATYGHRTHAVIPASQVIMVPSDISDEAALLTIVSGDVAAGVSKLGPALAGPVLVTGAGAIGLLAVFVLTALGVSPVDVVEPRAERRSLALTLGATRAVPPEAAAAGGGDYARGIECSSRDAAFAFLQERLRPGGRLCVLADGKIEPLTLAPAFHQRELTVVGSSDCPDYQAHAGWYFSALRRTGIDVARLFDRRIPVSELDIAFARLASGAMTATKVLVRYGAAAADGPTAADAAGPAGPWPPGSATTPRRGRSRGHA